MTLMNVSQPCAALKSQRGVILMTAYMLFAVISILSIALFTRNSISIQSAERNRKKMIAFNMAEAGFDDAYLRLKNNTVTTFPWDSGYVALDTNTMEGGYRVRIADMGNKVRQVIATGYSPDISAPGEIQEVRPVTAYVSSSSAGAFNYGVFAKDSIQMSGNAMIDSYDSRNGVYGAAGNAGANGDLGTDTTSAQKIKMSGNVNVKGDVVVGPNGNPDSVIVTSGNVVITGQKSAASEVQNPSVLSTSVISEGSLSLSGNTIYELQAGEHRFTKLSITGNAKLKPLGTVKIYVDGTVSIAGNGIATTSNSPPNTLIFVTQNSSVTFSGNAALYAGVYAPLSTVKNTGNGEIYGAVVSKTYQQTGNGNVHFDEALKDVAGGGASKLTLKSWQENNITAQSTSSATTS